MQPATLPEFGALLRFAEIAHGQPGRAQYQLALRFAIVGEEVTLTIDNRRLHQWHRHAGLDPVGDALILAAGQQLVVEVSGRDQRAGLGHPVGGGQLNATGLGGFVQGTVQRAAANDDFPAAEILVLRALGIEQHLQDRGHAMGEGDLLIAPQLTHHFRLVTPRVDLLDPQHRGHIGNAPGMDVEHRGDRHVHIVTAQQAHTVDAAGDRSGGQGVQHQLPVGEVHAFGVTGGTGGVERRGDRVFVEIREVIHRAGGGQQLLVLAYQVRQIGGLGLGVSQQQGLLYRVQLPGDGLVEADEIAVDQHEAVFGVVHGVEDLLR
ncbi:hypothetical protein D3C77_448490 [compost metagenome]